ncbi:MAG: hypothetical protein L0Y72_20120 [Gemmataceae bacterium]|nr:hypothetical protein [Gemmataceae bacterium]MCI0741344.1 hypothetical protein [Gemmataceae bacterium]
MNAERHAETRDLHHALGNCLNRIALQAAILKKKLSSNEQQDVTTIQDECKAAAAILERLRALAVS